MTKQERLDKANELINNTNPALWAYSRGGTKVIIWGGEAHLIAGWEYRGLLKDTNNARYQTLKEKCEFMVDCMCKKYEDTLWVGSGS